MLLYISVFLEIAVRLCRVYMSKAKNILITSEWQPISIVEWLNLKKVSAALFICKMGSVWNFPRVGAERTGFHPGSVNVKP